MGFTLVAMTGCGGSDEETGTSETGGTGQAQYKATDFAIIIPSEWETLEAADFTSQVPGEARVAFRSNFKNESFTANLNIGQKKIEDTVSSSDFAKSNLATVKKNLLAFRLIATQKVTIPVGEDEEVEGILNQFEGKRVATDPIVEFKQISVVYNGIAYTVTGAFLANEDESIVKQLDQMLDSFSLTP